jgi:hypothetical protein
MENQVSISAEELKRELEKTIHLWVERTFNFIQVGVLEKYCDNTLVDYIRSKSVQEAFYDWLNEYDSETKIMDWATDSEQDDVLVKMDAYKEYNGNAKKSFIFAFGDKWNEFESWCIDENEDDIIDWIYEQENYPMWNTCFEFRDGFYNSEEEIEKCLSVGLGVIEGLDDFNNLVFMSSAGHSFYSAYWIPLYLKLYPSEAEKFAGINYQDL